MISQAHTVKEYLAVGRKRERSGDRRPRAGWQQAGCIDSGKRKFRKRFQAILARAERQPTGKASAGNVAGHVVKGELVLAEAQIGADLARCQPWQHIDPTRLQRDLAGLQPDDTNSFAR